jgi:hypothetical protein
VKLLVDAGAELDLQDKEGGQAGAAKAVASAIVWPLQQQQMQIYNCTSKHHNPQLLSQQKQKKQQQQQQPPQQQPDQS